MRPDVLSMYRFYQSPVGVSVSQLIHQCISPMWKAPTTNLYGLGYALPYLDLSLGVENSVEGVSSAHSCFALMPAAQGVCHWPSMKNSATALVDDYHLPVADSAIERLLLVHALEHADRPAHLFREIWRVLAPGGQVIAVVPNRRRTWSALDTTPFGHGRPYSRSQLATLMQDQMLPLEKWDTALMVPPLKVPGASRMMKVMERSLHSVGKNMGGALIVSAKKQVYGALSESQGRPSSKKAKVQAKPVYTALPLNRGDQATFPPKLAEKIK